MNYRMMLKFIGNVLLYELLLMIIPLGVSLYYGGGDAKAFLVTIILMLPLALILRSVKVRDKEMYEKEGFLTVGLSWIVISVVGALPFVISGAIPSFVDSFFETHSD